MIDSLIGVLYKYS